jgi:hypothetical protein
VEKEVVEEEEGACMCACQCGRLPQEEVARLVTRKTVASMCVCECACVCARVRESARARACERELAMGLRFRLQSLESRV